MGATAIDTSLPVSTLLRQGTAAAHTTAEKSQGAAWLLGGELDRDEYIRFLMMLWHVYDILESALDQHAQLPALASIYNPHLLGRRDALEADIAHLLAVPQPEWQKHTIHTELLSSSPPQLSAYTSRIQHISKKEPQLLLSHSYVRYLGDLSGGQVLRRRVAKAYGLAEDDDAGVEFYTFGSLEGARAGNQGELRKVKEWFRDGMNAGVGSDDLSLKEALVQEAVIAFELNTGLFSALRAPTRTRPPQASILTSHPAPTPVSPPLGDPSTPTVSSPTSPFNMSSSSTSSEVSIERVLPKEIPIEIVNGDSEAEQGGRTYSVANVVTIILAVGIAHFILVTGKFVGTGGLISRFFPEPENPEFPRF